MIFSKLLSKKTSDVLISDYHHGVQLWQAALLEELGLAVRIESLSGHSKKFGNKLKNPVFREIDKQYGRGWPGSWSVDKTDAIRSKFTPARIEAAFAARIVVCGFPPAFYEALIDFLAQDTLFIINASHRFHIGRCEAGALAQFSQGLIEFANGRSHVLAASTEYEYQYIKHYLGIKPVKLYTACFHLGEENLYRPVKNTVLIGPAHVQESALLPFDSVDDINNQASRWSQKTGKPAHEFNMIRQLYPRYSYQDLALHRAVIIFPYSAYSISMIELYELNIPFFVPAVELLVEHKLVHDRALAPVYTSFENCKNLEPVSDKYKHPYDPNSLNDDDVRYWLKLSYFYQKENVIVWESPEDLFEKLHAVNVLELSQKMQEENARNRKVQLDNWRKLLEEQG